MPTYNNGYVRQKNDHPISFDNQGNLIDQITGEKGTMMLPGFTVTGISPETRAKNYSTSFDGTYGLTPRDVYGMMPIIGDALDIKDIGTNLYNRNYINAGIGAGLFLLPNVIEKPFKFAKKLYKERSIISKINKELEKGIKENSVLESYNKVPVNKDIGTAYDYLDFLDNIYPNSKLNATFYHGGPKGITQFKSAKELGSTNKGINSGTKDYGIYLADDKSLAQYYASTHKKADRQLYNIKVNVQNPMRYETNNFYMDKFIGSGDLRFSPAQITQKWYDRLNLKNYDGIYHTKSKNSYEDGELVMLNGNNIHIMGTPEESQMFRTWKQNPQYSFKPLQEEISLTPTQYDRSFLNYAKAAKPGLFFTGLASIPFALIGYDNYQKSKKANTRKSKAAKKRLSSKINHKETSHNTDNTTQFGITNYGFKNN